MVENQASDFVLQKCYETLSLSLYKVINHIVEHAEHVSLSESSNDLLLCGGNQEIVKRRQISDNVSDIVDHKFHFV